MTLRASKLLFVTGVIKCSSQYSSKASPKFFDSDPKFRRLARSDLRWGYNNEMPSRRCKNVLHRHFLCSGVPGEN